MSPELLVPGAVSCAVLFGLLGLHMYIKRDIERKIKAHHEDLERKRAASRVYWEQRVQDSNNARQANSAPSVVSFSVTPHNPGPRRLLRLE